LYEKIKKKLRKPEIFLGEIESYKNDLFFDHWKIIQENIPITTKYFWEN